jgi:hypothetical protein
MSGSSNSDLRPSSSSFNDNSPETSSTGSPPPWTDFKGPIADFTANIKYTDAKLYEIARMNPHFLKTIFYGPNLDCLVESTMLRPRYWPILGTYKTAAVSQEKTSYLHMLYELECALEKTQPSTLTAAQFLGAVNAVHSGKGREDLLTNTRHMMETTHAIAWSLLLSREPISNERCFKTAYYNSHWDVTIKGTVLEQWNFDWKQICASEEMFEAFLEVSARLRSAALPGVAAAWYAAGMQVHKLD